MAEIQNTEIYHRLSGTPLEAVAEVQNKAIANFNNKLIADYSSAADLFLVVKFSITIREAIELRLRLVEQVVFGIGV